jgi:hypothetical protein
MQHARRRIIGLMAVEVEAVWAASQDGRHGTPARVVRTTSPPAGRTMPRPPDQGRLPPQIIVTARSAMFCVRVYPHDGTLVYRGILSCRINGPLFPGTFACPLPGSRFTPGIGPRAGAGSSPAPRPPAECSADSFPSPQSPKEARPKSFGPSESGMKTCAGGPSFQPAAAARGCPSRRRLTRH